MKRVTFQVLYVVLFFGLLFTLPVSPVCAEQGLTVDPGFLNFSSTSGSTIVRTVQIIATDNVTDVQVIPRDISASGGQGVIHQESISAVTPSFSSLENGSIQSVPIQFHLASNNRGVYTGEVWFSYSPNGLVRVPVTITVKSGPFWPLVVLIASVMVSYLLFIYESQRKRRNEIERTLGVIFSRFISDKELEKSVTYDKEGEQHHNQLWVQIRSDIFTVQEKLKIGSVKDADTFLTKVQTSWDDWNNNTSRFSRLFYQFGKLIERINEVEKRILGQPSPTDPYPGDYIPLLDNMRSDLQQKFDSTTKSDQKELEEAIKQYIPLINKINDISTSLSQMEQLLMNRKVPANQKIEKPGSLWKRLQSADTKEKIDELALTINSQVTLLKTFEESPQKTVVPEGFFEVKILPPLHQEDIPGREILNQASQADIQLKIFYGVSFLVTVLILVIFGYLQLYLTNPVFGANPGDYATLALWGLLSGPTADAIAKKASGTVGL